MDHKVSLLLVAASSALIHTTEAAEAAYEPVPQTTAAINRMRMINKMDADEFHCRSNSPYYTIEGQCNNLKNPAWGGAPRTFIRVLPSSYDDGTDFPRVYREGTRDPLPMARLVSTQCLPSLTEEGKQDLDDTHSQMFMQFGQFFAHDMVATGLHDGRVCCSGLDDNGFTSKGGTCFDLPVPADDRYFTLDCLPVPRSVSDHDDDGISQQLNGMTSFIDHSTVYGSTFETNEGLRSSTGGKLRVDMHSMLPQGNKAFCFPQKGNCLHGCPHSGDLRLNLVPALTAMHLVFHREHNRLAEKLAEANPSWTDNLLYQSARRLNIAQLQNIVYGEYLLAVLGEEVYNIFGFNQPASYDESVNPTIFNSFAAAACRFGHSQVNNKFRFGADSSLVALKDMYFHPGLYCERERSYSDMMLNLLKDKAQKVDAKFPQGVTDHLFFGLGGPGLSTDLPAINIQRGRDHGLPPYFRFLQLALDFFGAPDTKFDEIIDKLSCLTGLYGSHEEIDLFAGGVSEDYVQGGVVGPTFAYLIGQQFQNLRVGDRLFFDLQDSAAAFTEAQVENIKQTTLAGIICRNADLANVQKEALKVPSETNPLTPCSDLPDLDFSLFHF